MTVDNAITEMAKRRRRYVVGYVRSGNTLYGIEGSGFKNGVDPMSLREARKKLEIMPCPGCAIFELVPIAVNR